MMAAGSDSEVSGERVVYEVNLTIEAAAAPEVRAWLPEHIDDLLALDGFEGAEWFELEPDEAGRVRWTIQYLVASREHLDRYFDEHAERMRGEGLRLFGGKFTARRRILLHRASFAR